MVFFDSNSGVFAVCVSGVREMKGSPVFPGFDSENNENSSYEFDPRADFSQFLEEARRYANHKEVKVPTETEKKQPNFDAEKKPKKKSWKNALFSFWKKTEDKNNNNKKQCPKEVTRKDVQSSNHPKPRGHVSGPVYRNVGAGAGTGGKHRRPVSGPLTNLFHTENKLKRTAPKREENEIVIPYVSLDKLNRPQYDAKAYGPVYLVN